MKKSTAIALAVAMTALIGASVWEGSAIVASTGELPETGYYVATNSFPRNTVVDVKNLENDASVRAVVSDALDTPGILVALSAQAAEAVGLEKRSVGKVRVTMSADPISVSRFSEGIAESADPDRNPRAALSAEQPENDAAETETLDSLIAKDSAPETAEEKTIVDVPEDYVPPAAEAPEETPVLALLPESGGGEVALAEPAEEAPQAEPEAASEEPAEAAETIAETTAPEQEPLTDMAALKETFEEPEAAAAEEPELAEAARAPEIPDEEPGFAPEPVVEAAPEVAAPEIEPAETMALAPEPAEAEAETLVDAEPAAVEPDVELAEETPEEPVAAPAPPAPEAGEVVLALEPAEERPPAPVAPADADIVFEPTVEPLAEIAESAEAAPSAPVELDPSLFLAPMPPPAEKQAEQPPAPPAPPAAAPIAASPAETKRPSVSLEFPLIAALEKGKYYVQLGAFADPAAVNETVAALGKTFPTAVQAGGTAGRVVYRVFVGPVNQGESGALLQRFRNRGYPDAFIKKGS